MADTSEGSETTREVVGKHATVQVDPERSKILLIEYQVTFQSFQELQKQAWSTFSIVSTLSVAGFALVGNLKAGALKSPSQAATWPISVSVGTSLIVILVGWLLLANRWWSFAQVHLLRAREIERALGMYTFTQTHWLRTPPTLEEVKYMSATDQEELNRARSSFPAFPSYRLRQQVVSSLIIGALAFGWLVVVVLDVAGLV